MKVFTLILSFAFLLSCAPKSTSDNEQTNNNSAEITKMESEILKLTELIAQLEANGPGPLTNEEKAEFKNNNKLQKNVDELRADLLRYYKQLDSKIDTRLTSLEDKYNKFKEKLDGFDNKYVSLSQFETLKINIESDFNKKINLLDLEIANTTDYSQIENLQKQIKEIQDTKYIVSADYESYFDKAIKAWSVKLIKYTNASNQKQDDEVKKFLLEEVSRIKISQEALNNKLSSINQMSMNLETKLNTQNNDIEENKTAISNFNAKGTTPRPSINIPEVPDYTKEIEALNKKLESNKQLLAKIKLQSQEVVAQTVVRDIFEKYFIPCEQGLAKNKYCYTLGSIIVRLGGQFIDPTTFKRTRKDLIRYLSLSGLNSKNLLFNPDTYLTPENDSNMNIFNRCHSKDKFTELIPPQELWPRSIILGLVMQSVEKVLNTQKKLELIPNKIKPASSILSWWRSPCYHNGIKGIDINNLKKNQKIKNSDHIYAAAFDPSFPSNKKASFNFYKEYIIDTMVKNDTFQIVHPLKSANLKFSFGHGTGDGHSKNGKMHIGIASEIKARRKDGRREWRY